MTTRAEKIHEQRVRRMADRQNLQLHRSRTRDPLAIDYGTYEVIGYNISEDFPSLAAVERWLRAFPARERIAKTRARAEAARKNPVMVTADVASSESRSEATDRKRIQE